MISLIFAGLWLKSTAQANKFNDYVAKYESASINHYDTECWSGPFTDSLTALDYMSEIAGDCDSDCLEKGT